MESKRAPAPSVRGDPAGRSTARALSPAPSGRFSLRRVSLSSSRASMTSGSTCASSSFVITEESSCVARETALGDATRYRFITWAAVKRNECRRMTASERLECPLLRCRQRFGDHEAMLRHLASCDHLGTCEYWCYEHMKVERFDDAKSSKRCLNQPSSKRRKMLVMAKSFFSSLGHKGRKGGVSGTFSDPDFRVGGNESLISVSDLPDLEPLAGAELSGTEILEIDSTEVNAPKQSLPQAPAPSIRTQAGQAQALPPDVVDPQALRLPELESGTGTVVDDSFMNWQPSYIPAGPEPGVCFGFLDTSTDWLDAGSVSPLGTPAQRPPLQVSTCGLPQHRKKMVRPRPNPALPTSRSKDLSPSSSVRSTTSTTSTTSTVSSTSTASTTSNVSSLVSPSSIWSQDSNTWPGFATLTSPTEDLMDAGVFLPEGVDYEETAAAFYGTCPPPGLDTIFELPADTPQTKTGPENLAADPLIFAQDIALYSDQQEHAYEADIVIAEEESAIPPASVDSFNLAEAPAKASLPQPIATQAATTSKSPVMSQLDTRVLVGSVWDALLEHVASSQMKIQKVTNNPFADHLRTLSPRTIAQYGLASLQALLDNCSPISPTAMVCLIHVVYALSVIVYYKNDVAARCTQLYIQSIAYSTVLSEEARPFYTQLAAAIWEPTDLCKADLDRGISRQYASIRRTPGHKGKERSYELSRHVPYQEDPLICTARNFLDDLECSAILGPRPESPNVVTSDLYAKHIQESSVKQARIITLTSATKLVIRQLEKRFGSFAGLILLLEGIVQRVGSGSIKTVRRFEIETLQAGKTCLPTRVYFDEFSSAVGHLCDRLYLKCGGGTAQRASYHKHGIALFDSLIADLDSGGMADTLLQQPPILDETLLFDDLFLKTMNPCMADNTVDGLFPFDLGTTAMDLSGLAATDKPQTSPDAVPPEAGDYPSQPYFQATQPPLLASSAHDSSSSSSSTTSPTSSPSEPATAASSSSFSLGRTEANDCCDICGYRPKGDPQWFKGSMAKHRKLQHSAAPPKIYKCPFPGCSSQYKNRPDNLRQHQIEKGHFMDGEKPHRRPSKRKKLSD